MVQVVEQTKTMTTTTTNNNINGDDPSSCNPCLREQAHEILDFRHAVLDTTTTTLDNQTKRNRYWTFDEAVVAMMQSIDLRKQCQYEGLQITKDFTQSRIAQKHLRVLGYQGNFSC